MAINNSDQANSAILELIAPFLSKSRAKQKMKELRWALDEYQMSQMRADYFTV